MTKAGMNSKFEETVSATDGVSDCVAVKCISGSSFGLNARVRSGW